MALVRTLLVALLAAILAAPAVAGNCGSPLSNWGRISAYPANSAARPLNAVAIGADGTLRWNGAVASRADIDRYLRIVPLLTSNNLTVLAVGRGANCAQVRATRAMMDKALTCTPQRCAEMR